MNNQLETKLHTFWAILTRFGIEVPPIQRDYAQGRETKEANKIRKSLLDSICNALEKNEYLPLDFVYGKISGLKNEEEHGRNKRAIQSLVNSVRDYALTIDLDLKDITVEDKSCNRSDLVYLIPLDGQQRLTTLFLIHWYIARRLDNKEALNILEGFRYKTRKSSTSFLKLVTSQEIRLKFAEDQTEKVSDLKERSLYREIVNLEFFSSSWLNDPTVRAMLIMIQEIHIRFQSYSEEQLKHSWSCLTEKAFIWFDFLDLKDFNLSDELYLKMNARGKQLSSFENFKAWLFDWINEKNIIESSVWDSYSNKFDIEWNDIFWNQRGSNIFDIDTAYFNFFKLLFLYDNVKIAKIDKTNFLENSLELEVIEVVINDEFFDWEDLCKDLFKSKVENYLQILAFCEGYTVKNDYLKDFFGFLFSTKGIKPSWQNLIRSFITLSFIAVKGKSLKSYSDLDFIHLDEYHRILFNLFDNAIIDNQSLYQSAIKEIEQLNIELYKLDYSIVNWIESFEYTTKSVFTEQQILEEILKYRLFANDEWKRIILEAENVTYFERQLNFWFYRSGIPLKKDQFDKALLKDVFIQKRFANTTKKIRLLFDEKGINRELDFSEHIFERALLSKCDYLLNEKGYKCFGRNSGRDVSWKRFFFRDRNSEQTNSALLEIFELDFSTVKDSFQSYIFRNLSENEIESWRKMFVSNLELYSYLGDLKYIKLIENHGWVIIKDSYKTYIGPHYELFSLDFYIKNLRGKVFSPFNTPEYYPAPKNNSDDFPCAYLDWKTDYFSYALDIRYESGEYTLVFFSRSGNISNEIKDLLIKLEFNADSEIYSKRITTEWLLIEEINGLVNTLSDA